MRVVTYARVSSLSQEAEGESLPNQERTFARAIERHGWTRVRSYREAKSAGSIEGRAEFTRMVAELPRTKPAAIVVDTLDRFTRNLREGLNMLEQLRGHRVGLLPLDWRRTEPINLDDDRDWADVVDEFTAAERERRRIRRRIIRSYEGRRERGATTTNRPPFGVKRAGDQLVADPDTAWIVAEADQRVLRGEPFGAVAAWARAMHPGAWATRTGVALALKNPAYVALGIRTPQTQAALDARTSDAAARFGGSARKHQHEFAGIFACGICVDAGYAPEESIMHGGWQNGRETIVCDKTALVHSRDHVFYLAANRVVPAWHRYIAGLEAGSIIERWASEGHGGPNRRALEKQLAALDQKAAAIAGRRDRALDLLGDPDPGVTRQVRGALAAIDADELALHASRDAVLGELAAAATPIRDAQLMRAHLANYLTLYDAASTRQRNALNRALVTAIGSRPQLRRSQPGGKGAGARKGYAIIVSWPGVDEHAATSASGLRAPSALRSSDAPPTKTGAASR